MAKANPKSATRRTDEQKRLIVELLACFRTPSEVVHVVRAQFRIDISPQSVEAYNPTTRAGEKLSAELRELFASARAEYLQRVENIGVANMAFRLRGMDEAARAYFEKGAYTLAMAIYEQAAREVGGMFTNKREVAGTLESNVMVTSAPDWDLTKLNEAELEELHRLSDKAQKTES